MTEKKFKEIQNHDTNSFNLIFFKHFSQSPYKHVFKTVRKKKKKSFSQMMEKKFKEIKNHVFPIFHDSASLLNGTMFG